MGYPHRNKGRKLYDLEQSTFFYSRDVSFHENIFPFAHDSGGTNEGTPKMLGNWVEPSRNFEDSPDIIDGPEMTGTSQDRELELRRSPSPSRGIEVQNERMSRP